MEPSVIERLVATNPDMEIWWDSSPLIYKNWKKKMIDMAPEKRKKTMEEELDRFFNLDDPAKSVIRGCTTNPPLSLGAVKNDPEFWNAWIDNLVSENKDKTQHELFWMTYKEVIRRGAEMLMPIWKASEGRFGYISGQLDPRLNFETEKMIEAAKEIRAISPNVMIKVPGTTQGVEVVKVLTSLAIPTNVTTCFMLPQIMAVANAAMEGIKIANENKVDMGKWRAVITMMIGRLTENPELDVQAARRNIILSWQDKHWFGIHVFRKAYRLLTEGGYASKLLACSMRDGPNVAGKYRFWDVEMIAGGEIVYTMPPYVLEPLWNRCGDLQFYPRIHEEVPSEVLYKLSKIPYAIQAMDPNGLEITEFNDHPATVATAEAFAKASIGLEDYVGERMKIVLGNMAAVK